MYTLKAMNHTPIVTLTNTPAILFSVFNFAHKMPSAAVGNNAFQCAIPDLGNGSHSETMKQFLGVIDKKVRNMEKKKVKMSKIYYGRCFLFCIFLQPFLSLCGFH